MSNSRMICASCQIEMRCSKTGVVARWRKEYARRGDVFKCPRCERSVILVEGGGYIDKTEVGANPIYEMEE
jgi:hypothetical protein